MGTCQPLSEEGDQTLEEAAGLRPSGRLIPSFLRCLLGWGGGALSLRLSRVPQEVSHRPTRRQWLHCSAPPSVLINRTPSIPQPQPEILHIVCGPGSPAVESKSVQAGWGGVVWGAGQSLGPRVTVGPSSSSFRWCSQPCLLSRRSEKEILTVACGSYIQARLPQPPPLASPPSSAGPSVLSLPQTARGPPSLLRALPHSSLLLGPPLTLQVSV